MRSQLRYFLNDRTVRRNLRALLRLALFVSALVILYSVLFQVLMQHLEGRSLSWITGFYWTIITMSTTGYGDVVFHSDLGKIYTIVVLFSGILIIFIVLPYVFVRYLYQPLLEAQLRVRTPRMVPPDTRDHVIICHHDQIAEGLMERLEQAGIRHFVVEEDVEVAGERFLEGIPVIFGEVERRETYEALRVQDARMVLANLSDPENTNIVLTVREVDKDVPVVSLADQESAVETLRLSGANHVLPLKRWLGEQLANRINASHAQSHVVGQYRDLLIAEMPVHQTPLAGKTIRETRLRENTGVSIIGVWERGRIHPARPDMRLTNASVPILIGTEAQLDELDFLLAIYDVNPHPVLVIGGGGVGTAAARALRRKEVDVHLIEKDGELVRRIENVCERITHGDATDEAVLREAGVTEAPSVLLTTSNDPMNIYLASICRRLNEELRIVSRITHERNIEAIHRAGADFVLGSASLGVEAAFSILQGRELVVLGEGVDLFSLPLPSTLQHKTLAESGIGAQLALSVIAVRQNGRIVTNPPSTTRLHPGAELVMLGSPHQRQAFIDAFGIGTGSP